jgi:YidC/Oxa1 family membrane protein insertase
MTVNEKKIRQKIQVQMSKPMKKSKWQQRLEDLQKQQQQMQKNKR